MNCLRLMYGLTLLENPFSHAGRTKQKGILSSRIQSTQEVRRIIEAQESKPSVLIQASAVGIYGTSKTEDFTEEAPPAETDFLSHTSRLWEAEGQKLRRSVFAQFIHALG